MVLTYEQYRSNEIKKRCLKEITIMYFSCSKIAIVSFSQHDPISKQKSILKLLLNVSLKTSECRGALNA